jgi:pilus assembly protein CpaE
MPKILAIDDSPITLKIIISTLTPHGYEVTTAPDGEQGLALVRKSKPDIVISDVMMPGIDGYEVTRRIRRDPIFAGLPILILTAQRGLEERIKAFEAGADDYMAKPFEPAELAAHMVSLLRRSKPAQSVPSLKTAAGDQARFIAVHSLRGGVGCSSMAVNLGVALAGLWDCKVLLADLVTTSGQAALMLDLPLRRTWADITHIATNDLDWTALDTIIIRHPSGLHLIAAPTSPTESERLTNEHLQVMLKLVRSQYDYVITDLTHDFSGISLCALDAADVILLLLAPDLASIRAAAAAIQTYKELGYASERIQVVKNWTFQRAGFSRKEIESTLQLPIRLVLPFASERFVGAINQGAPIVYAHPEDPVAALIEDLAFGLGKKPHQTFPPAIPKPGWLRAKKRLAAGNGSHHK